jgi:hypothetical protein
MRLTKEEQLDLFLKFKNGDEFAIQDLMTFFRHIAIAIQRKKKISLKGYTDEDFISIMMEAAWKSVVKFDPNLHTGKISSYVIQHMIWVRNRIFYTEFMDKRKVFQSSDLFSLDKPASENGESYMNVFATTDGGFDDFEVNMELQEMIDEIGFGEIQKKYLKLISLGYNVKEITGMLYVTRAKMRTIQKYIELLVDAKRNKTPYKEKWVC